MATKTSRPRLLTLCQELKFPPDRQMQLVHAAMKTENPEQYLKTFAKDLADGKAELPPALAVSTSAAPCEVNGRQCSSMAAGAAGNLRDDDHFYLCALEEILVSAAERTPINQVRSPHGLAEREFTPEERRVFHHLRLDDREVVREYHRCDNLLNAKKVAGTAEERQAARARATATAAKVEGADCEAAKLQRQIEALNEKLATLRSENDQAQADVQRRDCALAQVVSDCTNENMLVPTRRLVDWPKGGVAAYIDEHFGTEPGIEIKPAPRVRLGARVGRD